MLRPATSYDSWDRTTFVQYISSINSFSSKRIKERGHSQILRTKHSPATLTFGGTHSTDLTTVWPLCFTMTTCMTDGPFVLSSSTALV
jgi:hypothetical protein